MHHYFIVEEGLEFGMKGLRMIGRKGAEAFGGLTAAHDVMEHFNLPITVDTELMALGASIFCRDRYGVKKHSLNYGSDLFFLIDRSYQGDYEEITSCSNSRKCDPFIEETLDNTFKSFISELRDNDFNIDQDNLDFIKLNFRLWMRKGYRMANRKYGDVDSYSAYEMFSRMTDDLNKFLNRADVGEMICVNFVPKTLFYDLQPIGNWTKKYHKILDSERL